MAKNIRLHKYLQITACLAVILLCSGCAKLPTHSSVAGWVGVADVPLLPWEDAAIHAPTFEPWTGTPLQQKQHGLRIYCSVPTSGEAALQELARGLQDRGLLLGLQLEFQLEYRSAANQAEVMLQRIESGVDALICLPLSQSEEVYQAVLQAAQQASIPLIAYGQPLPGATLVLPPGASYAESQQMDSSARGPAHYEAGVLLARAASALLCGEPLPADLALYM